MQRTGPAGAQAVGRCTQPPLGCTALHDCQSDIPGWLCARRRKDGREYVCIMLKLRPAGLRACSAYVWTSVSHVLQAAGLQYNAQPAHDSDSEGSDPGEGYSDEDWLEDEVRTLHCAPKTGHCAG